MRQMLAAMLIVFGILPGHRLAIARTASAGLTEIRKLHGQTSVVPADDSGSDDSGDDDSDSGGSD